MEINNLWVNNTVVICSKFVSSDGNQFSVRNTTSVCSSPGPTVFRGKFCENSAVQFAKLHGSQRKIVQTAASHFKCKLYLLRPSCWRVHCMHLLLQNITLRFLCKKAVIRVKVIKCKWKPSVNCHSVYIQLFLTHYQIAQCFDTVG